MLPTVLACCPPFCLLPSGKWKWAGCCADCHFTAASSLLESVLRGGVGGLDWRSEEKSSPELPPAEEEESASRRLSRRRGGGVAVATAAFSLLPFLPTPSSEFRAELQLLRESQFRSEGRGGDEETDTGVRSESLGLEIGRHSTGSGMAGRQGRWVEYWAGGWAWGVGRVLGWGGAGPLGRWAGCLVCDFGIRSVISVFRFGSKVSGFRNTAHPFPNFEPKFMYLGFSRF
ncbi:unnamed protein product [Linum trigynum]|uniref:Uncharacterized protein n=1 Tax=Linum trigynum TaxID=586398 RepID=A0AAV2FEY3_9ROSI